MKKVQSVVSPVAFASLLGLICLSCSSDSPAHVSGSSQVSIGAGATLSIFAPDGHLLLRSIAEPSVAGDVSYVALGFSTATEPELVAPSFVAATPVAAPPAAARHAATRLRSSEPNSAGFVAVFDTDDPEGRTMTVSAKVGTGLLSVDVTVSKPEGVTAVFGSFESPSDEAFHGLGGRRESTNLRGHLVSNWVFDYRFPNAETGYYYPQPMFLSSKGYALWLNTVRMATFRLASERADAFRLSVADSELHFTVATEGGTDALKTLTAITGRHRLAPAWSMGPTISRTVKVFTDQPSSYQAKVTDDLQHILTGDYLVEAYAYEGWATLPAEFVAQTNATLVAAGIHPMLYIRSFVADDGAGTEPAGRFDEAIAKGFVATHADGTPYKFPSPFPGADAAVIDFTNPAAVTWWKGLILEMLETGADGFMADFGEQVLPDMVFFDGSTGDSIHNQFPVLQHRATREALDAFTVAHPEREPFFFVRSGYAGSPGSTSFEGAAFPGDETTDFAAATGLPSIVPDMLNRAIFGAYGFTTDIGGYADFGGKVLDEELFLRWLEAAVFTTHFRVHNSGAGGVRMPWSFSPETETTWKEMAALHVRARPLIQRLWTDAQSSAEPPIRPLWLNDASPDARMHADDQWLVGDDLLVAPVLQLGATSREVWFPGGCWQMHGDGPTYTGPTTAMVDAPLRVLPWFTRCGTTF